MSNIFHHYKQLVWKYPNKLSMQEMCINEADLIPVYKYGQNKLVLPLGLLPNGFSQKLNSSNDLGSSAFFLDKPNNF
jgi:hypothetical protein